MADAAVLTDVDRPGDLARVAQKAEPPAG